MMSATSSPRRCDPRCSASCMVPRYQRYHEFIKLKAPHIKVFFHSCGCVYPLIPDLIEAGIDILNPVQVNAAEMGDTKRLKREFGRDLTFWGGIDTQHVMPHGTPQDVKDEVKRRIDDLAPGGGYVFDTVHNIQADVPGRTSWPWPRRWTNTGGTDEAHSGSVRVGWASAGFVPRRSAGTAAGQAAAGRQLRSVRGSDA